MTKVEYATEVVLTDVSKKLATTILYIWRETRWWIGVYRGFCVGGGCVNMKNTSWGARCFPTGTTKVVQKYGMKISSNILKFILTGREGGEGAGCVFEHNTLLPHQPSVMH